MDEYMHDEMRAEILAGIAMILWACAWANHAEEHGCANLAGEITDMMPDVPAAAVEYARKIGAKIEKLNGASLPDLFLRAKEADAEEKGASAYNDARGTSERFGECLAFMAMGHGVSWFDDHAKFPLETRHCAEVYACELQEYAAEHCDHIPDEN